MRENDNDSGTSSAGETDSRRGRTTTSAGPGGTATVERTSIANGTRDARPQFGGGEDTIESTDTVELHLRHAVGRRGGKLYGPSPRGGTTKVPRDIAISLGLVAGAAPAARVAALDADAAREEQDAAREEDPGSTSALGERAAELNESHEDARKRAIENARSGASGGGTEDDSGPKPATKTALREYGDADALRELARRKGIKVGDDENKQELIDALYEAQVSLDDEE